MGSSIEDIDININNIIDEMTNLVFEFSNKNSPIKNITPIMLYVSVNFLGNLTYKLCDRSGSRDYAALAKIVVKALEQFFQDTLADLH
jgi:hypothetical protein